MRFVPKRPKPTERSYEALRSLIRKQYEWVFLETPGHRFYGILEFAQSERPPGAPGGVTRGSWTGGSAITI